ncbi:MAG: hypothetical protein CMJ78_03020 [Planctomycetaceae bacterium]|nr:hypothetical protein [Planctomycetaceae bacterium]
MFLSPWLRSLKTRVSQHPRRRRKRQSPSVERFEDRVLLTSFIVNSTDDTTDANPGDGIAADSNGNTTLRAAIQEANALAGSDTIILPAGNYTLTIPGADEDLSATGDLDVIGRLLIVGAGADETIIDADEIDRALDVSNAGSLRISDVTVQNGLAFNAGGIQNRGALEVVNSVITSNDVTGATNSVGGGIGNAGGEVLIINSVVSENTATVHGAGIYNNFGEITILEGSQIIENSADGDGGGISNFGGIIAIDDTLIDNNSAGSFGGGISNDGSLDEVNPGTINVSNSTISANTSEDAGGGIYNFNGALLTILDSTIGNNISSTFGGGIENSGSFLVIEGSTISGNSAVQNAGGIDNDFGVLRIDDSLVINNAAGVDGGGIDIFSGSAAIVHTTITGNTAQQGGGGIVAFNDAAVTLVGNTIINNQAGDTAGGGVLNLGTLEAGNNIIAGNVSDDDGPDVFGAFTSLGNNLVGDPSDSIGFSDGVSSDQVGTSSTPLDPQLGTLADNGGPTLSFAPLQGSPVIDAGVLTSQLRSLFIDELVDQRQEPRNLDGDNDGEFLPDIGAVEFDTISKNTFSVDSTIDSRDADIGDGLAEDSSGATSLRAAVQEANDRTGEDVIILPAGTFRLAFSATGEDEARSGDLDITDTLTIIGAGDDETLIDGAELDRVFHVFPDVTLNLSGVKITNGLATTGAGILIDGGTVEITDSKVTGNSAEGSEDISGGGITNNAGTLLLTDSVVSFNSSEMNGGGISNLGGTVTLENTKVSKNTATIFGGGLASVGGTVVIGDQSNVTMNTSTDDGGGLHLSASATATIDSSTITDNDSGDFGGGIHLDQATANIVDTTISDNTAAQSGGGLNSERGVLTISTSTISGNTAGLDGGGIDSFAADTTISTSTISGNSAGQNGGGIVNFSGGATRLTNVTIANNQADGIGGGINNLGALSVRNSIIAMNTASSGNDFAGIVFSQGSNLVGDATGSSGLLPEGLNADRFGISTEPLDPLIAPLADNGGTTQTHQLLTGSPAIDAANSSFADVFEDQSGNPRVLDGTFDNDFVADIGATEFNEVIVNNEGDTAIRVFRNGLGLIFADADTGAFLFGAEIGTMNAIVINGSVESDRLVADFVGGNPIPAGGLTFDGGDANDDGPTGSLEIVSGDANDIAYSFDNATDGSIVIDGTTLSFAGTGSITDDLQSVARSFTFSDADDDITLTDNVIPVVEGVEEDTSFLNDDVSRFSGTTSPTVDFRNPSGSLSFDTNAGDDRVIIEALDGDFSAVISVSGGDGDDMIDTSAVATNSTLDGGSGNDELTSGAGTDVLTGGEGDDELSAGVGNDQIDGQGGTDTIVESADVDFLLTDGSLDGLGNDSLVSVEAARLTGGASDNSIDASGFSGATRLRGGSGDDQLTGGSGDDRLIGEAGADVLSGRVGNDQ